MLIGFPQDEGVRRNRGRPGAAGAPAADPPLALRLTPWEAPIGADLAACDLLDLGNVRVPARPGGQPGRLSAKWSPRSWRPAAVPVVLGGGHETAFGHYLGYVRGRPAVAIINLDAHLDVRPMPGRTGA